MKTCLDCTGASGSRFRQSSKPLKNDKRTTCKQTPTHTFDFNGKVSERLQKGILFPAGKLSFFKDFDLGAPGVPKETTKLPKDGQGTPKGRPRVHKCLKKVWKWSPKVAKS